jgi:hypothetical protein
MRCVSAINTSLCARHGARTPLNKKHGSGDLDWGVCGLDATVPYQVSPCFTKLSARDTDILLTYLWVRRCEGSMEAMRAIPTTALGSALSYSAGDATSASFPLWGSLRRWNWGRA